jgi:hypothetical protein
MASVNFLYRSTKDKATLNLRLLFRYNDNDYVFGAKTKFEVAKDYWTKQHNKKSKDIEITNQQTETNTELNKIENHVLQAFNSVNPDEVNKQWLISQINFYYNPVQQAEPVPQTLVNYIEYYKTARRHDLKPVMVRRCNVLKSKLEKYESKYNTVIRIENVNDEFRNSFLDFSFDSHYALSTIKRELVFIKSICTHAKKKGINTSLELSDFSKERKEDNIKIAEKTFVYLNYIDLKKLQEINPNRLNETYKAVRDLLLISCYTGQRISDFKRFNKSMLTTYKNVPHIQFTQVKTGHKLNIPLRSEVIAILERNGGDFPKTISDVRYNKYVKDVCRIAKINDTVKGGKVCNIGTEKNPIWRKVIKNYKKYELVSSHIGRRSFATNNFNKIPTSILKTLTAHKTEKMLLTYVNKSGSDLQDEILKYFV